MSPFELDQLLRTAIAHHQSGRLALAEALYGQVLGQSPDHDAALHGLGVLRLQGNRPDLAIDYFRRASLLQSTNATYHGNLGIALLTMGKADEAVNALRRCLELKPNFAEAHNTLGNALMAQGHIAEAIDCYERALALKPNYAEAHNNLGNARKDQGKLDDAVVCYCRALEQKPLYAEAYNNLGNARQSQGKIDDALSSYRRALELRPDYAETHNGMGQALMSLRLLEEAEAHFNEAIRLRPHYADAHFSRSTLWLLRGEFTRGWEEYEWRWEAQKRFFPRPTFAQPQWDGGTVQGRSILLYSEQGFGDTLQFIRYIPMVSQAGGDVVVGCQPELKRLLKSTFETIHVVDYTESLPPFDVQCPLLSLPRLCRTTLDNIPPQAPKIAADRALIAHWRTKLAEEGNALKVGLAWAGSKGQANDHNRSLPLSMLKPLIDTPNVRYYSLQKAGPGPQSIEPAEQLKLIDKTAELTDFADTAALIANLDLVISVDTSVSHLAGAMDKPVWTLLSYAACWRYLLDREDSPWYPSMRLFRQPSLGDWTSVVKRAQASLRNFAPQPRPDFSR